MNNFSVDESVTSATGLPAHGNGVSQNLMAMQLNGNTGSASSSNAHALAQQPKQIGGPLRSSESKDFADKTQDIREGRHAH